MHDDNGVVGGAHCIKERGADVEFLLCSGDAWGLRAVQANVLGGVEAESDIVEPSHIAKGGELSVAFFELAMELGHVGVGDVRGKLGRQAIEADLLAIQVFEDIAQVGEADAEMRLILPATAVVGAQRRTE